MKAPTQLFNYGTCALSSGRKSKFKIDCDALTEADLRTCAELLKGILPPFDGARSVSTGGNLLATLLQESATWSSGGYPSQILIVDDVFTTGASISKERDKLRKIFPRTTIFGAVIFARAPTPKWITALFTLNPQLGLI